MGINRSFNRKNIRDAANKILRENQHVPLLGRANIDRPIPDQGHYKRGQHAVIVDVGSPPEGNDWPTHVRMGGQVFMMVPQLAFEEANNTAFNRGYKEAVEVFGNYIDFAVTTKPEEFKLVTDKDQRSYVQMVRENKWGDLG